uniref:C3H1-type domain-containing protein n=1 Tax=Caenorhabditis japonica TaxID=281687 RepID=A0A8R1EVN0_CAEJA
MVSLLPKIYRFVSIVQKVAPTPVALKNVKTEFSPNVVKCEPKPKKETFIVHPHPQKAKKLVSPKIHIQIPPEEDSVGQSDNDGDDDAENSSQATGADFDEEREEVNYEEEEEEEENIEVIVHAEPNSSNTSFISACINSSANYNKSGNVPQSGLNAELSLREKLLAKCGKSRQSPDVSAVVSSSSPDRAESSRNFLLKICKFDLNGTCTRGRDCTYLHLIDVNDGNQQRQLLESVLRDVLGYKEVDIEPAIDDVVQFLPRFREFEKLIHHFLNIVMQRNPEFRNRLFEFFATGR